MRLASTKHHLFLLQLQRQPWHQDHSSSPSPIWPCSTIVFQQKILNTICQTNSSASGSRFITCYAYFSRFRGFHMKRKPSRSNINLHQFSEPDVDFGAEAERHLGIAIQEVATTTPQLNQANSHSLYIASIFIFICSLAKGPQHGEYLAFRDDGDMPSLYLFLGVRSILEATNKLGTSEGLSQLHSSTSQESPSESEALSQHINHHEPFLRAR